MNIYFREGIKQNLKAFILLIQIDNYAGNYERDLANILIGPDDITKMFNNTSNNEIIKKHDEYYKYHNIEKNYFLNKIKKTIRNYCGQKSEHYYCMTNVNGNYDSIAFFFKKELNENDFCVLKKIATDYLKTQNVNILNVIQYKNGDSIEFNSSANTIR